MLLSLVVSGSLVFAHTPNVDSSLADWCVGAISNTATAQPTNRVEDSSASLSCGECSITTSTACEVNADCPGGETCVNIGSKTEVAWWDNRTDGAVNDLATFATTQDGQYLYVAAELWVDPDPISLPFAEMAIDYAPGGVYGWHDPKRAMVTPGRCSVSTDRGCTEDADCHFCAISEEPTGACSNDSTQACLRGDDASCGGPTDTCDERLRTCGSGCDPLNPSDICDTSETCEGLGGSGLVQNVGTFSSPAGGADFLIAFDFGIWLLGFDLENAVLVMEPGTDLTAPPLAGPYLGPWRARTGCLVDDAFAEPTTRCDFIPVVNPGASGGSGGPPGSVEVAIPWCAFGCTDCPEFPSTPGLDDCGGTAGVACDCTGTFGPGQDFRFTIAVARGVSDFDFKPDAGIEDAFTETIAFTTTTSSNSCPGMGLGTTDCEIGDITIDSYVPRSTTLGHEVAPGGQVNGLTVTKNASPSITLNWLPSCSSADTAYGVYEGTIGGTFNSHVQLPGGSCSIGTTSLTFNASTGNRYYLVVPEDGATEGSYGARTSGVRPQASNACASQSIGNCP